MKIKKGWNLNAEVSWYVAPVEKKRKMWHLPMVMDKLIAGYAASSNNNGVVNVFYEKKLKTIGLFEYRALKGTMYGGDDANEVNTSTDKHLL